jgi:hypothetical protein
MKHKDFTIGLEFYMRSRKWRCTDVGSRVITAIHLESGKESWWNGPPYAIVEQVFDENDLPACSLEPLQVEEAVEESELTFTLNKIRELYPIGVPQLSKVLEKSGIKPRRAILELLSQHRIQITPDRKMILVASETKHRSNPEE